MVFDLRCLSGTHHLVGRLAGRLFSEDGRISEDVHRPRMSTVHCRPHQADRRSSPTAGTTVRSSSRVGVFEAKFTNRRVEVGKILVKSHRHLPSDGVRVARKTLLVIAPARRRDQARPRMCSRLAQAEWRRIHVLQLCFASVQRRDPNRPGSLLHGNASAIRRNGRSIQRNGSPGVNQRRDGKSPDCYWLIRRIADDDDVIGVVLLAQIGDGQSAVVEPENCRHR